MLFRFVLCLICFFFESNCSYALNEAERPLVPFKSVNWQRLMEGLELLNQQIKYSSISSECVNLFVERGTLLLFTGAFEAAINDFTYAIENSSGIPEEIRGEIIGEALWGRMWGYAFLGKKTEFFNDMNSVSKLLSGCYDTSKKYDASKKVDLVSSQSSQLPVILCKSKKKKSDDDWDDWPNNTQNNNDGEGVQFCIDTVHNTISFMKGMCNAVPDKGIKTTLYLFIEGLGREAIRCCTARGFWNTCVHPMLLKMNQWKIFGIPADPYWDND